ncbi:MAG TPA: phospholipase D-like domain-containing protein [Candidatus Doudnabacteria bacterium]|nr:phospholipase D-like domain-containing protein [Candidatus Doudnabacteria bacterium]
MKLNRDLIYITIIVALIAASAQLYYSLALQPAWQERNARQVEIYYNKQVAANELLIEQINDAEQFVYFAIYTFTRQDIQDALIGAKYRGLDVQGVMDYKQSTQLAPQQNVVKELQSSGISIVFNDHSAIMHLKTLVTDKSYFTGSFNWTASGTDRNDEIIEIGRDDELRQKHLNVLNELFRRYSN